MKIHERIKLIRECLFNNSNLEFAKAVNEKPNTTSNWISGRRNIGIDIVSKIANSIPEVSKTWLLNGEGNMLKEDKRLTNNDEIIERIENLISHLNLNKAEFSKLVNINQADMSQMLIGKKAIGESIINKIALSCNVNKDWLLSGYGNVLNNEIEHNPFLTTQNGIKYYKIREDLYRMVVPFVSVKAYGKYIDEHRDAEESEFGVFEFPVKEIYHGNYRAFEIKGDSMDDNTRKSIANGDVVLGRELGKDHWKSPLHINDFANWIIVLDNTIICKQIISHDTSTGDIVCHSLNPDKAYADFTINLNDVRKLYNIVQVLRFI